MAAFTYPGVYIEEVSSGQHTITGVATSIASFVGWSNQGSVTEAVMVESWSQYQSLYGGMIPGQPLGYAVYQFFLNGGSQAYIVRLIGTDAVSASLSIGGLEIFAANPGAWANNVQVTISNVQGSMPNTTFNLQVSLTVGAKTQLVESYTNLSVNSSSPYYALTVINNDSNYITFTLPATAPTGSTATTWSTTSPSVSNASAAALTQGFDGTPLTPNSSTFETALDVADALASPSGTSGLSLLNNVPIFNLLCVPGENSASTVPSLHEYCYNNRAFLIVDAAESASLSTLTSTGPVDSGGTAYSSQYPSYGGFYYPWILAPDPQVGYRPTFFPPCGYVAGAFAATDASRGVWKAPAGIQANLSGSLGLQTTLTDLQNGGLNQMAVNCLRQFPVYGNVVWGARTMDGADAVGSQYKYVPIRRLALFLESSLYQGTQWVVFEPNDEQLWGQVRLSIGTFLQDLFLKGAFAGSTREQAYFVKCDGDNNPDSSIALGIVNITVGFAPLYPAEFVVIQITQMLNS
jgi:phage tail sheath protein FI